MPTNALMNKNIFLFFIVLFEFSVYVGNDMVLPAVSAIYTDLKINSKYIPWCVGFFLGGAASIQLFCGPLSDHLGRRKTMVVGGVIILIGNALGIFSFEAISFFIARILQGMGLCFISVAGYACLHELFDQEEAVKNIARISATAVVAPLVGPALGSLILIVASWKFIFLFTFSSALIAVIGLYFTMPESLPKEKRVHFQFSALIPAYKDLSKNRVFMALSILSATVQMTVLGWIGCSPIFIFQYLQLDSTTFGLIQIPIFLGIILGQLALSRLVSHHDLKKLFFSGFIIALLGGAGIILSGFLAQKSFLVYLVIGWMGIFCFGFGIFNVTATRLILESTEKLKGIASGFNAFIVLIMATFELLLISFLPVQHPLVFVCILGLPPIIAAAMLWAAVRSKLIM